MEDRFPYLISVKLLPPEFSKLRKIQITRSEFTLGRGLDNTVVVPVLAISRKHCKFRLTADEKWILEDLSTFGLKVNTTTMKKGDLYRLRHQDIIQLDVTGDFIYRFNHSREEEIQCPRKRVKLDDETLINDVKMKFEESQSNEIRHIEDKIENTKQMQTTSLMLKNQLEQDMAEKIRKLEIHFAEQIENLKGEKHEVEQQKLMLEQQRDLQLETVKRNMETTIAELMDQIQKHNETESELLKENTDLKQRLLREREEFLSELHKENSSKQELLQQLEEKIREQEEIRLKEREETEKLKLAKEQEVKELEEKQKQREIEMQKELAEMKSNLETQLSWMQGEKAKLEQTMKGQIEEIMRLNEQEKIRMQHLLEEKAKAEQSLTEAQQTIESTIQALTTQAKEREVQLAALASERIQKEAEQSGRVIVSLQEQLESVRSQQRALEAEKTRIEKLGVMTTKQETLTELGDLMESELQCSICAELLMTSITLNCSHTFCKYCITVWKRKKRDCPICRAFITSECRSLVLDSFIDKMVENLTEEMKVKREAMLKDREAEERAEAPPGTLTANYSRRRNGRRTNAVTSPAPSSIPTMDLTNQSPARRRRTPQVYRMIPTIMIEGADEIIMPGTLELRRSGRRAVIVDSASQVSAAPTMGVMGGVFDAGRAATGHLGAPIDRIP